MRRAFALGALLLAAAAALAEPTRPPYRKIAVIHLREESQEAIDPSVKVSVLRRIEEAKAWGADCIVFDIESYGGYVFAAVETADEIYALGRKVHTVAYVGRKAISGAAMLSMSCREIVMSETANIGDSQVIFPAADGTIQVAPEKAQTTVAAKFRTYAEGNGYPVPIAEAMVRVEMEVIRYRTRDGGWAYYRADRADELPSARQKEELGLQDPPEVVVREGELPTFTAPEAVKHGLCSRLEPDLKSCLDELAARGADGTPAQFLYFDWTWAERFSRFLLGIKWLLFLGGAGALYFALKVPGTGIPEALAIIFFGLFFGASAIAGFAGAAELVLFIIGVGLLVVEIFILPGFGVAGLAGLACVLVAIGLAAVPPDTDVPDMPTGTGYLLVETAKQFLLGTFLAIAAVIALAKYLPSTPLFRRFALDSGPSLGGGGAREVTAPPGEAVSTGMKGVAESLLRPAGRARIGGRTIDVVSDGAYIPAGTPVTVVQVSGNRIVVRAESEA